MKTYIKYVFLLLTVAMLAFAATGCGKEAKKDKKQNQQQQQQTTPPEPKPPEPCISEAATEYGKCADKKDNDCDAVIDCEDKQDCAADTACKTV